MSARVLVAMSGGVDSSVAAAILRERGYDVVGVAMRLAPEGPTPAASRRRGTCCSHEDFEDARRVAERMDFPFYVVDLRAEFGARVIDNFVSEYLSGRTPNPCVMCNREIKFDRLRERAAALGADYVATGHYARIERDPRGRFHLLRAADATKDQSYFLFTLGQVELRSTLFPLGAMTKAEVRERARQLGLANADKPESQEICFVPDGDYARFVERASAPERLRPGRIVDLKGRTLAAHAGVHRFTVGQRRGLGLSAPAPLYVREIRAQSGEVVVGPREGLAAVGLVARDLSFVDPESVASGAIAVEARIRYRHPALPATARDRVRRPRARNLRQRRRPGGDARAGVCVLPRRRSCRRRLYRAGFVRMDAMRFAVATLGCKVNQYDSAMIESRLGARGMERCEFDQVADVYIVNTCTVTDRADAESLKLARRARRLNPRARVVMTGCLAQANPAVLAAASEIDAVVGLGRPDDLERAALGEALGRVMVTNLRKERAPIELGAVALEGRTRAFLKLQEGCDQFCSFCIVPTSRGTSRSVEPRRIFDALDRLAASGFREVILTGVHLGGYGRDLDPPVSLEALLEMVAERSPIDRVRISSLDPEELSDRILEIMAASEKFCPHLHLPLQAGTDATLVRMRRRYDVAHFSDRVERILELMPAAAIGTDLIAGFPGETSRDFDDYFKFIERLPLAYFHVFPYSVRAGTTAAKLPGKVAGAEIKRRAGILRALGEDKRRRFIERFCGSKLKVLLEERGADGRLKGYSRNYVRVLVEGPDTLGNDEVEVVASRVEGVALAGEVAGVQGGSAVGAATL